MYLSLLFICITLSFSLPHNLHSHEHFQSISAFPSGTTWDIQYSGTLNLTHNVMAYDIDLFDTNKSTIDALHKRSIKVICYFSGGSY